MLDTMRAATPTMPPRAADDPGQPAIGVEIASGQARDSMLGRVLLLGGAAFLLGTGLLLWMREGDRLFTEGLIAAIAGCF
jgi:hypothetical protein